MKDGEDYWAITSLNTNHDGHECVDSPLAAYPRHLKDIKEFVEARALATGLRGVNIPYSNARRVMEAVKSAIPLSSK